MTANVRVRYSSRSKRAPRVLQALLKKIKGVEKIAVDEDSKTASFRFTGTYKGLVALQSTTTKSGIPTALLSHAYVVMAWKAGKTSNAESLRDNLEGVNGVQRICCVNPGWGDLYVNINELDFDALLEAARSAGYKPQIKTHERIRIEVEGDSLDNFIRALWAYRKALVIQRDGAAVILLSLKKITDSAIRAAAIKTKVRLKKISRSS